MSTAKSGGGPRTVSVETMRRSDAYTIENFVPSKELMWRAGTGIFEAAGEALGAEPGKGEAAGGQWPEPVAIACGKGNNAGDGYVVAELLHKARVDCTIVLLAEDRFSEDGLYYFQRCQELGVPVKVWAESVSDFAGYKVIVDAILGTGFAGDVRGAAADMINAINAAGEAGAFVISADINSGLNGDTGMGTTYVRSDLTVSIGDFKHGHFQGLAGEAMKSKVNKDIGIIIVP